MSKSFVGESNGLPNSAFYSLKWNKFHTHLSKGLNQLLEDVDFTDVTLACDGNCLRSHKMVLSLCSPFFKRIFKTNRSETGSTVVILNNVRFSDLQNIIRFVYNGQVDIKHSDLTSFLQAAELLQIEGLAGTLAQAQDDQNSQTPPQTQDDGSSSSALVGCQVQISSSSHGTFPSDNFHSHSDNSNSHSSTFSTLLQGSHNIPTSPPVAKRPKTCFASTASITPPTPPVAGKSLHTSVKTNHTFRTGFNIASSTISRVEQEQEVKFNDNNDDVVVIDPLHEDPLQQNYQEQNMLNISESENNSSLVGIFPDDKVDDEQEVFLDSQPPDIRIEGVFSTSHPSPASSRIASTSSVTRQLKQGGNYSVADEIDDEETETLPQTIANFDLSTFTHSQSQSPKNKRKLSTDLVKQEFPDKNPFFSDVCENNSDSNEFQSRTSLLCSLCSQAFTSSFLLKVHKTNCHTEGSVTCPVCFKKYKNKNSLKVHKSVNHRQSIMLPPDINS